MTCRGAITCLWLGVALAGAGGGLGAAPQVPQQFRAGVETVEVTVTVTDDRGRPVAISRRQISPSSKKDDRRPSRSSVAPI